MLYEKSLIDISNQQNLPVTPQAMSIEFQNVTLAYANRIIFHNFNAEIKAGEFIGIFGPNGSGKSSLLKSILGLFPTTRGNILVLGKKVERGHIRIGYLPQIRQTVLNNQLSGRMYLLASLNGFQWGLSFLKKNQRNEIVDWAIEIVEANSFIHRPFIQLSGGERQRLLLAQALLDRPKIILLDEPLAHLDPHYQESLIALVQRIRSQLNATILFTSHDVNPLLSNINRALYLSHGKIALGSVDEIISSKKLSELYDTKMEVIRYKDRLLIINK